MLDFNDLEHLALQILTEKRKMYGCQVKLQNIIEKFKEVMVDEYQDVNQLQEAILYWLREPDDTKEICSWLGMSNNPSILSV